MDCPFEISIPTFPEALHASRVRGRERVSGGYRFDVVALSDGEVEDPAALLDQPARLTLLDGAEPVRAVHGVVARVEDLGRALRERRSVRLTVVPRAHRAKLGRRRRVFQDLSTVEIVTAVLAPHEAAVLSRVVRPLAPRTYCVQYDESDWDFCRRILAEEGLFFFFDHSLSLPAEILVIADTPLDQAPIDGEPRLRFRRGSEGSSMKSEEDHVTRFAFRERLGALASHVHGYDLGRPDTPLESRSASGLPTPSMPLRTVSEHEHPYEADVMPFPAEIRLQQARRRVARAQGESACKRLAPGRRFSLSGHEAAALDREWALTAVEHEAHSSEAAPAGAALYTCKFEAIPADRTLRPRWSGARPRQVAETAVVVGPEGREVHTDRHGRVKVQFHWDGEGRRDERSSCWVRVAQTWAGAGWGFQFIPRIGMEVVVTFLGGDVDRPLVTGCVVNATHPPPFPLPASVTKSGIRTRTFGGHGAHELSFDDATGTEKIYLHSQRDYHEVIENNHTSEIHGGRQATVRGDANENVGGSAQTRIDGSRAAEIAHEERLHVKGRMKREVELDDETIVHGSSATTVHERQVVEVRRARSVIVGTEDEPAHSDHAVYGSASMQATSRIVLRAEEGLRIVCGDSMIELLPDKILLQTPTLELSASEAITATAKDGPSVTLGDDVEVLSKKIKLFSEGGALELDKEAKVAGQKIKLGYDPSKPDKSKEEEEPETKPFSCRFTDYWMEPFAGKHFHATTLGLRFEGDTDGDGNVKIDIPRDATEVQVRLWIDEYPEGRQQLYALQLKSELPPSSSITGGKLRLKNLGYYHGEIDEVADGALRAALLEFQDDHKESHGLDATGEYDAPTQGALEEIHGS